MPLLNLAANHKVVGQYYLDLKHLSLLHATHEGAVRGAFQTILQQCARQFDWTVIAEYPVERPKRSSLRVDGAIVDSWKLVHGYWEAKDEHDDLKEEVKKKIALGYPTGNILFQAPDRAILYQDGRFVLDESLKEPKKLVEVLKEFFRYEPPAYAQWELAVEEFKNRVPELARALVERIHEERKLNSVFRDKFGGFVQTCRQAINPNLSEPAVEEMLIQHMLTERIFRKVFNNPDFARRNAIAAEIEGVVDALTKRSFNRDKFLSGLERFYGALETTAGTIDSFTEKQGFLNTVYEKFFQGFSVKVADTHGIVYTPQPIVRFMVRSVDEILNKEFGRSLGSKGVHILDPFLGTGNFLLQVMRHIPKTQLAYKYEHELHGNEVMLLPYYIAAMNIEHEYSQMMADYKPFDGLCLVDTFELAEAPQPSLFTAQNTARVEKQRGAPIFIALGNPPYNAWQLDENDKNRNRTYPTLEKRVLDTYVRSSKATLVNSLGDPYIKAIRWASDRVGPDGIVAFVTNNSYIEQLAFDGVRRQLAQDFDAIYCIDLGGNVRKNPKLSGSVHNVFGIQVGVSIGFFVRKRGTKKPQAPCRVFHVAVDDFLRREDKLKLLDEAGSIRNIKWNQLTPDGRGTWLTDDLAAGYEDLIALGAKPRGEKTGTEGHVIFEKFSNGIQSNSDAYVFNFSRERLTSTASQMVEAYNSELDRWLRTGREGDVENFIRVDETKLKWVRSTRRHLAREYRPNASDVSIRRVLYRPYCLQWHFFDRVFNEDLYQLASIFPNESAEKENRLICVSDSAFRSGFSAFALSLLPERHLCASSDAYQFFPFYIYQDGNRRENITDWVLSDFRRHYADETITKWDIFYYVYGLLQHPAYRQKYNANLKRELPRIPHAPEFRPFAQAGERLAELHVDYEKQPEYPLNRVENPEEPLSWRVEKMRLSKQRDGIFYNDFLTLVGIPPQVFEYRLGNRSALEWVIDQYQVFTDKRSGITNDPNQLEDPEYIVRLIGQVITVSLETVSIIRSLPPCEEGGPSAEEALTNTAVPPVDEPDAEPQSAEPPSVKEQTIPKGKSKGKGSAPTTTVTKSVAKPAKRPKTRG